ncbi:MAG TPA: hypothetical protein VK168_17805 [Saprospiraceae bacterium]|nr:hypothetical protein [Saprospiraceae bacterium]
MQDLDDLFKDRLEEEAPFPNRSKQWQQLSQRLDAFDAGAGPTPKGTASSLPWWKLATLVALASAGYFAWKGYQQKAENNHLKVEIARLQNQQNKPVQEPIQSVSTTQETSKAQSATTPQTDIPVFGSTPKAAATHIENEQNRPTKVKSNPKSRSDKSPVLQTEQQKAIVPALSEPIASLPELPPSAADKQSTPVAPTVAQNAAAASDSIQVALALMMVDSLQKALVALQDSLLAREDKPMAAAEIKPVVKASGKHFRIGAHATMGFVLPKQKGVSSIRGQGISFEARVWKSLWVSATADWLNHNVATSEFIPKFHSHHDTIPKPPGGGGGGGGGGHFNSKLVLVESAIRQQHLGIGLRYNLPVKFWVQPAVRVAHEWVHISPSLATYKFRDDDPGGPGPNPHPEEDRYTAEKFPAKWLSNKWRMGLGLEKELPNWTFGLWADYSKDLSAATPSFDALYVRASAQYRF